MPSFTVSTFWQRIVPLVVSRRASSSASAVHSTVMRCPSAFSFQQQRGGLRRSLLRKHDARALYLYHKKKQVNKYYHWRHHSFIVQREHSIQLSAK